MRPTLLVLLLLLPALAAGQSLSEVAKKEKERREKNKREGRKALIISEEELFPEREEGAPGDEESEPGVSTSSSAAGPPRGSSEDEGEYDEEGDYDEESADVPKSIPPDLPLEQRLEMFQRMKRHYEQQVREIDQAIAENNERIRQLDVKIAATSAAGGAGLPVAPQTDASTANTQFTGQESESLVAEKRKLETVNESMARRKDQLKIDLQTQGRVAGIPPGYLRF